MSRMRVLIIAAIVGVAVVMPTPMAVWAGEPVQKVAKQEKRGEKKAKEDDEGKPDKEGRREERKEKTGKKEHKEKNEKKGKKAEKDGAKKVTICHRPPGTSENARTITVGAAALEGHLAHGDAEGPCN